MKPANKNKKLSAYKILVILIVSLSLVFTAISSAFGITAGDPSTAYDTAPTNNENVFSSQYHKFYQIISDNDYMITPVSAGVAGTSLCGVYCGVIGIGIGTLDEFLYAYGYTDKRSLTRLLHSFAAINLLKAPLVEKVGSDIVMAGFAFMGPLPFHRGMLDKQKTAVLGAVVVTSTGLVAMAIISNFLPENLVTEYVSDYGDKAIAPVAGAIVGAKAMGKIGALVGGAAGVVDELLIANDVYDKHYLTWLMIPTSTLSSLKYAPEIVHIVGPVAGLVAANYEDEIVSQAVAPIKTIGELYEVYSDFIPQDQLNEQLEKQALSLIAVQLAMQYFGLKFSEYNNQVRLNFGRLDQGDSAWPTFMQGIGKFGAFLIVYIPATIASGQINEYFSKTLEYAVEDSIRDNLYQGEIPLRLLNDKNATVALDNLRADSSTIAQSGTSLITGAVTAAIQGAHGIGIVVNGSPNIFIASALYNQFESFVSNWVSEASSEYRTKVTELSSQHMTLRKHIDENLRAIVERGGIDFERRRLEEIEEKLRERNTEAELLSGVLSVWWTLSWAAHFVLVENLVVANEIHSGRIKFNDRILAQTGSSQLSGFLAWPGRASRTVTEVNKANERIKVLEEKIHGEPDNYDQIERMASESNQLRFRGLSVGIAGGKHLVSIEDVAFEMGKTYVITGKKGCGKSSFLSKVKKIKENGISGRGNIYYPQINGKDPKIVMASQKADPSIDLSLVEIVHYPDELPKDLKLLQEKTKEINSLLAELNINEDAKSSGGEEKSTMVLSAIIKKPDILILDEGFSGLDPDSVVNVQQMLRKYLPDALIMVVDHHAGDNNYDGFYYQELHFADQQAKLQEIVAKSISIDGGSIVSNPVLSAPHILMGANQSFCD